MVSCAMQLIAKGRGMIGYDDWRSLCGRLSFFVQVILVLLEKLQELTFY